MSVEKFTPMKFMHYWLRYCFFIKMTIFDISGKVRELLSNKLLNFHEIWSGVFEIYFWKIDFFLFQLFILQFFFAFSNKWLCSSFLCLIFLLLHLFYILLSSLRKWKWLFQKKIPLEIQIQFSIQLSQNMFLNSNFLKIKSNKIIKRSQLFDWVQCYISFCQNI